MTESPDVRQYIFFGSSQCSMFGQYQGKQRVCRSVMESPDVRQYIVLCCGLGCTTGCLPTGEDVVAKHQRLCRPACSQRARRGDAQCLAVLPSQHPCPRCCAGRPCGGIQELGAQAAVHAVVSGRVGRERGAAARDARFSKLPSLSAWHGRRRCRCCRSVHALHAGGVRAGQRSLVAIGPPGFPLRLLACRRGSSEGMSEDGELALLYFVVRLSTGLACFNARLPACWLLGRTLRRAWCRALPQRHPFAAAAAAVAPSLAASMHTVLTTRCPPPCPPTSLLGRCLWRPASPAS